MTARVFAAIDLGASGGRVIAGVVDDYYGEIELHTMHRFPNGAVLRDGHLRWAFTDLFEEVLVGLTRLAESFPLVESIGIDTWGVDYGLLDGDGTLLAEPVAYRDDRTADVIDCVHACIPRDELYRRTGLQYLPFNTIYQLAAEQREPLWSRAAHVILLPDLLAYWLTGELRTEATNASTTGLVDATTGGWSTDILERIGIPEAMFPPIQQPGAVRGRVRPDVAARVGLRSDVAVTTVGSHDTASAVVGVPATGDQFAYVSSGTWSLVGVELAAPILTAEAQGANFTNERGVDGCIRFLRNVGGLWLLQEALRSWSQSGHERDLVALLAGAALLGNDGPRVDVDHPSLIAPGDMATRIGELAGDPGMTPAQTVRCLIDSLADAYARTVADASLLADRPVSVIHIVGGGSQNELLCQRTADVAGLPVVAGPVEATAVGNVLVQARARYVLSGSLDDLRARVARVRAAPADTSLTTPGSEHVGIYETLRSVVRFERIETDSVERRLRRAASVADLRRIAKRRLPGGVFDYIDGAAEDERTLAANERAFAEVTFRPRVLRGIEKIDVTSTILGASVAYPLVLAPTGFTRIADTQGELAVARAAARAGLPYTLSTLSTRSIEEVRAVSDGRLWFQVYAWRDRAMVKEMIDRAAAARFEALVLTVDTAVLGRRERDVRRGFSLPPSIGPTTLLDGALHPAWTCAFVRGEPIRFANVAGRDVGDGASPVKLSDYINTQFDPALSWHDIDWLRSVWSGPIVIKGVQSVEDAVIAADAGVDAIALSNHGGRQLDGAPAAFSLVAPVADAVGGRVEIICDGGVRRGSDIVKAVAAGANACMAGRAYLYALGAAGERGVDRVLAWFVADVERTMLLVGAADVASLDRSHLGGARSAE